MSVTGSAAPTCTEGRVDRGSGWPYLGSMSGVPDNHELARQFAVVEERMNTMQADLSATLERFRADMARRDTEAAKRETRTLLAMAAMIGLAVAIIGFLV